MARRPLEKELCIKLKESRFSFIPDGKMHIEDIYELVHKNYRKLCDDNYYCSQHCRSGNNQPEWKHAVRSVLGQLKSVSGSIRKSDQRKYWDFYRNKIIN